MTTVDEKTYESPFNRAINAEEMGADTFYQNDFVRVMFTRFMLDAFERNVDLRGQRIEVLVHQDGLFCTIRRYER